jgi:DNA-binding XRE family transcriptional regulator
MMPGMSRRKRNAVRKSSNNVRKFREQLLMSKAELAKAAGLSVLTVDRVERGQKCRMATKRKIIKALGLNLTDKGQVFGA